MDTFGAEGRNDVLTVDVISGVVGARSGQLSALTQAQVSEAFRRADAANARVGHSGDGVAASGIHTEGCAIMARSGDVLLLTDEGRL